MTSNNNSGPNSSNQAGSTEQPTDGLLAWLERLAKHVEVRNALEISSSGGAGTTQAFIRGLSQNTNKPKFFCVEAAKPRFEALRNLCAHLPWVYCFNESSLPVEKFPTRAALDEFYKSKRTSLNKHGLNEVLSWLEEDRLYVEKSGVNGNAIAKAQAGIGGGFFDLVLIDGSEFLGEAELEAIYGARLIVLDDVLGYKNFNSRKRLLSDPRYALIAEDLNARNGYSVFKRTAEASAFAKPAQAAAAPEVNGKNIKIAGQNDNSGKDLTQIDDGSSFADAIRELVRRERPRKIIETGTYLGTGTTKIIASALREFAVESPEFFSIEVNPNNFAQAQSNLAQAGLNRFVRTLLGVSVPRTMLPTIADLEEKFVRNIELSDVYIDHKEHERAILYYKETDFHGIPEDLLRESLAAFDFKPDFVLLDSGGHMGNIEFNYLLSLLKGPCFIALDDVFHVKHAISFKQIKGDKRFVLLTHGKEKFGFALAHFDPSRVGENVPAPGKSDRNQSSAKERLVWVRSDSIGDAILSSGMLESAAQHFSDMDITVVCQEHIAELYKHCPYVKEVVSFNRRLLEQDERYLESMAQKLLALNAKVVIQSTFSRDMVGDFLTMATGAPRRIAPSGDNSNLDRETWEKHTALYTDIIPIPKEAASELERHKAFLNGLGINVPAVKPTVWIGAEERAWAKNFFESQGLERRKTLFLFAGAQHHMRLYERYGEALAMTPELGGCAVVALGAAEDSGISARNLNAAKMRSMNLCGHTTLLQAAALLEGSLGAFGAETGLMHMACALNVPNAVLLGGGHFGRFMPYASTTKVAALPLDCFSCNWQCSYSKAHCIADVSPRVLSKALKAALMGSKGETYFWEELGEPSTLAQGPRCSKAAIEKFDISTKKPASEVSVDKTLAEAAAIALMNFGGERTN